MKDKFILKHEALFVVLASHSEHLIESMERVDNPVCYDIAYNISKYFKHNKVKRYTGKRGIKLVNYLKDKVEPILEGTNSPLVHLMVTLNYLIVEAKHLETLRYFGMYKQTVVNILEELELSEHSDLVYDHYSKLDKLI